MSLQTIAKNSVELCNQGKNVDVMRTTYAADIVSVEGDRAETSGQAPVIDKSEVWQANNSIHAEKVRGPFSKGASMNALKLKAIITAAGILAGAVALIISGSVFGQTASAGASPADQDLAQQIFDTMIKVHGFETGHRAVHAKGIVCKGTFAPSEEAAELSKSAHFQGDFVSVTVSLSDGAPSPSIADNSPDAGPRGMAIRFTLPGGGETDIVAMSHNGFVVGSGEEFLALQKAIVATDPSKPHPWPVEEFLGSHPAALKFVQENRIIPASFATEAFFSNDSFLFINKKDGARQVGRYKILPVAGQHDLSEAEAKAKPASFLIDEIKARLAARPVKYRLVVQLPNDGDPTNDPSIVWPDDRKTIEMGTISLTSADPNSAAFEKELAFDPMNLAEGIEPSDDPLPALRSRVYALSAKYRRGQK